MAVIGRPKRPITDPCPCGGNGNWSWHRRHRRLQCQASIDKGMIKEGAVWIPGSSIYVPEQEEP